MRGTGRLDITIATNLMESRLLLGSTDLFKAMRERTGPKQLWPSRDFFAAKWQEQIARHHKFHDTAYNLEPNIKEGPGGLRDIQMIGWVAKRHFNATTLDDLVDHGFLTAREYQTLISGQNLLWRIRYVSDRDTFRPSPPSGAQRSRDRAEWERLTLGPALATGPDRSVAFTTVSDLPIERLYTPADRGSDWDPAEKLGYPGEFPYTRGPYPSMYRGRLWTMRMFAGFGRPEDTNARFKYLLEQGQTGLSTAFDMPALMGFDADHPRARGEVGKEGVSVSTLADFEVLFRDIPLDRVTTSMTINCTASVAVAMYLALADRQGVSSSYSPTRRLHPETPA